MQKTIAVELDQARLNNPKKQEMVSVDIPKYLHETYWWAYLHPRSVRFFEKQWTVNTILWGNFARLRESALDELGAEISGRILQIACVYGDLTPKLAQRLLPDARLDVVDVAPIQLENLERKIKDHKNVRLDRQDASSLSFDDQSFDQTLLFFLLHELPAEVRAKTVQEALRVLKPGGKLVIVDYHRPIWLHPHFYIMWPILKTLEPFALDLWQSEIAELIPADIQPASIDKSTFFGGLYQKVVIVR